MRVEVRVELNAAGLEQLLNSPQGAVARDLQRRAIRVESQAKVNASGRPGPNVRTGRLRSSITWRIVTGGTPPLFAEVGSRVRYAAYIEYGSRTARPYPFLRPALQAAR